MKPQSVLLAAAGTKSVRTRLKHDVPHIKIPPPSKHFNTISQQKLFSNFMQVQLISLINKGCINGVSAPGDQQQISTLPAKTGPLQNLYGHDHT